MLSLIMKYIRCRIFVGQNGRIWVDGEPESVDRVLHTIHMIEAESTSFGLTNKIEEMLKNSTKDVR